MKKIKTYKLQGRQLDWAVLIAMGIGTDKMVPINTRGERSSLEAAAAIFNMHSGKEFSPSTDPGQGGVIIERERISTTVDHSGVWLGFINYNLMDSQRHMHSGRTALEAAMRCYVQSKLGPEVDLP